MIYLTDYISDPSIELEIIGNKLQCFSDNISDKKSIEVLLIWHFLANKKNLESYPNLKAIVRYGVGFDNVDLDYCKENEIKVFNNPDYGVDEVSDTALAMIMSLSRCIGFYNKISKNLTTKPSEDLPWQENINQNALRLKESTLGIVGVGRIGSALANKMKNIVGNVHFYDPYVNPGYEKVLGAIRHDTLDSLLSCSDIVSIHTPLNSETKGFINHSFIDSMKPGSILVNTARGSLLESHSCLFDGLVSKKIGAIGLDVLPEEPPMLNENDKLLNSWLDSNSELSHKIIINPHTSYYSPASYREMRVKAATMALNALNNNQTHNQIV
jgi:C-terminal binding protein